MLTGLSEFLRYSLTFMDKSYVQLKEEIHAIKKYLEIEKTRFEEKLVYLINIDSKARNCKVLSFIIQPFVENAIKHGTKTSEIPLMIKIDVIGESDSVKSAINVINKLQPDLLFLDIQLYNETGFDLLEKIDFNGNIIFVTAYDAYAIRAFEVNATDYLLKPISQNRLALAIERIKTRGIDNMAKLRPFNYTDRVLVSSANSLKFVKIEEILCILASGDYTTIMTSGGNEYLVSKPMNEWEIRLPDNYFCRIHRSTIINIEFIEKTEKWFHNSSLITLLVSFLIIVLL